MAKAGIKAEEVLAIGVVLGGGYLLVTGQLPDIAERVKGFLDQIGGGIAQRLPTGGGGGGGYSGGGGRGCAGTTRPFGGASKEVHGGDPRVEWTISNVQWAGIEATAYITVRNPKKSDEVSFKFWGPRHSERCCSWYMIAFDFSGRVRLRYEQPHPDTHNCATIGSVGGSLVGRSIGYRAVITPLPGGGAHLEAWADTGGGFRKIGEGNNPCGKRFGVNRGAQVQIRIDNAWDSTMQCGGIRQIGSGILTRAGMGLIHELNEQTGTPSEPCIRV